MDASARSRTRSRRFRVPFMPCVADAYSGFDGRWLVFAAILATLVVVLGSDTLRPWIPWDLLSGPPKARPRLAFLEDSHIRADESDSCPQVDMRPRRFIGEVPKGNIRLGVGVASNGNPLPIIPRPFVSDESQRE